MGGAVLHGEVDGGARLLGRFGLEDGELPLLGDREDRRAPRPRRPRGPGTGRGRPRSSLRATAAPRPAPVAHPAGLLELHDHLRVVVAVGVERLGRLELPALQQHREDGLQLHHGEGGADAAVPAGPEGDPGPRVGPVLLARLEVAGRARRRRGPGSPRGSGCRWPGWPPRTCRRRSGSRRTSAPPWRRAAGG